MSKRNEEILKRLGGHTQNSKLFKYMLKHGSITPIQAWEKLGIYRLSARIYDLRGNGADITTLMVETMNNNGEIKRIAKYVLD